MRNNTTRAAAVVVGACALAITAAAVVPAATSATLPKYYYNQSTGANVNPGQFAQQIAHCNTGDHPSGGGYTTGSESALVTVETNEPFGAMNNPNSWNVTVLNNGTNAFTLHAFVDCVHY
jgi:hypothetical protein